MTLDELAADAAKCTRCDLYQRATGTVFGAGRAGARLTLVGEQPGDQEDRQGQPFVGPAGRLLDRALREAGIERGDAYVTNAVKHFKWVARGKRRIHQRPNGTQIMACRHWLEAELAVIRPEVAVALGAVAGEALFGRGPGSATIVAGRWRPRWAAGTGRCSAPFIRLRYCTPRTRMRGRSRSQAWWPIWPRPGRPSRPERVPAPEPRPG